ncbi:MAG TPA: YggS family pyridoxal phosphate-dependent enzyme [Pyrinomonadaceae bacterium]|nr:YggS family pyridoxal phosphate-dependent enzyme [Pyrinomonadaceae bacterium]
MKAETGGVQSALRERLERVGERVREAARRAGRDPAEVTLVGVSKTHPAASVREAFEAGLRDFGENRVQEADGKIEELKSSARGARWHLIGHLQSNKARRAARLFDLIHTIDSAPLARKLEHACAEDGRERLDVLIQVDLAGEETKGGAPADELPALARVFEEFARVRCVGLMTLPPYFEEVERVRPYFRRLRELRDGLKAGGLFGDSRGELSMGMSHDFEAAVEEGATLVRIGTAIFGERG